MSILDSLWRFVDPIAYRKKQEERRRQRKVQPPGLDDNDDVELPPSRPQSTVQLRCRICSYSGGPEHRFCPRCLAETMERRR